MAKRCISELGNTEGGRKGRPGFLRGDNRERRCSHHSLSDAKTFAPYRHPSWSRAETRHLGDDTT